MQPVGLTGFIQQPTTPPPTNPIDREALSAGGSFLVPTHEILDPEEKFKVLHARSECMKGINAIAEHMLFLQRARRALG